MPLVASRIGKYRDLEGGVTTHIMVINGLSEFRKLGYPTVLTIMAPKQKLQLGIRHARHNC